MEKLPYCYRILNGIRAAFKAERGEREVLEDWLGLLAQADHQDDGDRLFSVTAETVSDVVVGLEGSLLDLSLDEQSDVLAANQFFVAITFLRDTAMSWTPGVEPAEKTEIEI